MCVHHAGHFGPMAVYKFSKKCLFKFSTSRVSSLAYGWGGLTMSDEKRLIKHLLENYDKVGLVGRPVFNTSEVVNVQMNLSLLHVLDIDPDLQRFEFIGVVMMVCKGSCLQTMSISKTSVMFVDLCVPLCLSVCLPCE